MHARLPTTFLNRLLNGTLQTPSSSYINNQTKKLATKEASYKILQNQNSKKISTKSERWMPKTLSRLFDAAAKVVLTANT